MTSDLPVLLVTGASRGIGRHLVEHYVQAGYEVVGCSRSPVDDELLHYTHVVADVSVEDDVTSLFREIRSRHGRLDAVVNNAGENVTLSLTLMTPASAAARTVSSNLLGTFLVSREAAKLMMRRRTGRIVNLGSMAAKHEVAGEAMYSASKAAVNTFTRVLAKEVYGYGITCNVVAPSAVATGMTAAIDPEALSAVLARNAIPEQGTMGDVTNVIDWLLRPESQAVTGQVIYLGGT